MNDEAKTWAIVPAAGIGKRMMSDAPKQYLPLGGRRVIDHALAAVCDSDAVDGVVVGVNGDDRRWRSQPFAHKKIIGVSVGGDTRARTVLNALTKLLDDGGVAAAGDWVMVHDGVRPCLLRADIERLVAAAQRHGDGAVLAVKITDALKCGDDGVVEKTVAGKTYWRALTPQMFRCGALRDALRTALTDGVAPVDESAAMESAGVKAALVEGHPANIKITVPADLELAASYLGVK